MAIPECGPKVRHPQGREVFAMVDQWGLITGETKDGNLVVCVWP